MIELPSYINETDFSTYLDSLYPEHDIDSTSMVKVLFAAYVELYLSYDVASAPNELVSTCVYYHACHIWRSEGSRSARLDLISQTVTEAGVVKEKYDGEGALPFSPFITTSLAPYKKSVSLVLGQRTREMEY